MFMRRLVPLLVVLVLALVTCVAYGAGTCVCSCHCTCKVNLRPVIEKLDTIIKLLKEEVHLLKNLTVIEYESQSTMLNLSRSIAEMPSSVAKVVNETLSNFTINNHTLSPRFSSTCSDILNQLLIGIPELRCFAPSSWLGQHGTVTMINAAAIGFLAAVSLWSIVARIMSGEEPAEAFKRCGGLLVKCCIAGIFLTLLPSIVSAWNSLVYDVTNFYVLNAFKIAWITATVVTLLPLFMPFIGKIVPALEVVPSSLLQMHMVFTGFVILLTYIKLLIALLVQIALPIGIALQEVRIRALRSLGLALESTFWGLLIGTLLGAVMTQLIGGMYVHAGEVFTWGIQSLISGAVGILAGLGTLVKCGIFGWLFHCSLESAIRQLAHAAVLLQHGADMLIIQLPMLLTVAVLGTATPLFMVVLAMWKKFTPLQFLDVMIGTTTGIYFIAEEYGRRHEVARAVMRGIAERVEKRRREIEERE